MKLVSKFALALSLASLVAAPAALAQSDEKPKKEKKGKEAATAAPKRNYSKPFIAAYLILMGLYVLIKSFAEINPIHVHKRVGPLGFFGALIDSIGGGGWGPIVTSTLLARGNHTRYAIGTVNAVEFFVTLTSSAVFIATIGFQHWNIVLALAIGGVAAAPVAGLVAKKVPHRPMMFVVGLLIIGVSARTLWGAVA